MKSHGRVAFTVFLMLSLGVSVGRGDDLRFILGFSVLLLSETIATAANQIVAAIKEDL